MATKLDKVLNSIGEDGDLTPYFEELVKTNLFVPIDPESDPEEEGEEFDPFILQSDDMIFIPVFDTLDRFKDWAKGFGEEIRYLQVEGQEFFDAIDLDGEEVHVVVNHMTETEEMLYPENIQWIQENAAQE